MRGVSEFHGGTLFRDDLHGTAARLAPLLGPMLDQPDVSCVVVDYSCPDRSGDWVETHYPTSRVVRVPDQNGSTRPPRNSARHADAPWIGFVDSDVVLDPGFAAAVLPTLEPGGFYRTFSADRGLGGTFICSRPTLSWSAASMKPILAGARKTTTCTMRLSSRSRSAGTAQRSIVTRPRRRPAYAVLLK